MNRRDFMRALTGLSGAALASSILGACSDQPETQAETPTPTAMPMLEPTQALTPEATPITMEMEPMMPDIGDDVPRAQVTLIKPEGRMTGVERALDMLGVDDFAGKRVLLKPNFNSADAPPASSHNDTIRALVQWLRSKGAEQITIADRSGMGITRRVMEDKGILDMAEELDLATIAFDELAADQWEMVQFAGSHWENGFPIAKPVLEADAVVSLCCLKTHRFGGHFSMALKNSVGVVASTIPGSIHDFMMSELHVSPHQRLMIAEINSAFTPELVLLDAMEAFANQGPEMGRLVSPGVIMAASDRIAIDAVGVAILRHYGTTNQVSQGSIFQLEQIARAVQLGLGVDRADKIDLLTEDTESSQFVDQILPILDAG